MSIEEHAQDNQPLQTSPGMAKRLLRGLIMFVLPLAILIAGGLAARKLYTTGPKARQRKPESRARLVDAKTFETTNTCAVVQAMGTVIPAREVMLHPRVSGEVVEISSELKPGGLFAKGDFVLKIDPIDYELAVEQTRSEVARAEYEYKLEQGSQAIAQQEWDLLDLKDQAEPLDRQLALRKPQLQKAEAALAAAKAALKKAELQLERTTIRAPFNCVVVTENVDIGTQLSPQTTIAKLIGTDAFWVQATVPVDQLQWIRFPDQDNQEGSEVIIRQQTGKKLETRWRGRVVRLMGDLEPMGRMARVLVRVEDPLGLEGKEKHDVPLLIGSYVNAEISGIELSDVIQLPRSVIREGNEIWLMNDDNELEIREIDVLYSNRDSVFVESGINEDELVVTGDLATPVEGMALTLGNVATRPADDVTPEQENGQDGQSTAVVENGGQPAEDQNESRAQ